MNIKITKLLNPLFSFIILLFLWVFFVFNIDNPDYATYQTIYVGAYGSTHEIGFDYLCKLFYDLGVSFFDFRLIVYTFVLFSFWFFTYKLKSNTAFVFVLYLFFPFVLDGIQIRSVLSYSIALYGILVLYSSRKYKYIIFTIIILLASSIHYMSLFYLIFLLIKVDIKINFLLILTATLTVAIFIINTINPTLLKSVFTTFFYSDIKANSNLVMYTNLGMIISILFHSFIVLIYYYYYYSVSSKKNSIVEMQMKLNVLSIMLFPFYNFTTIYFRITRLLIFSNNSVMLISNKDNNKKFIPLALSTILNVVLFLYYIVFSSNVLLSFFGNNIIFIN